MDPILPSDVPAIPHSEVHNRHSAREAERLRETAKELEGVFLGLLLKAMRGSAESSGLFKEGTDAQMYREMFDQEVGRSLARAGGIGLAKMIVQDQGRRNRWDGNTRGAEHPESRRAQGIQEVMNGGAEPRNPRTPSVPETKKSLKFRQEEADKPIERLTSDGSWRRP